MDKNINQLPRRLCVGIDSNRLAMILSIKEIEIPHDMLIMGEVGLSGEILPIPYSVERTNEAKKHGFKKIIVPQANVLKSFKTENIDIIGITNLNQIKDIITG